MPQALIFGLMRKPLLIPAPLVADPSLLAILVRAQCRGIFLAMLHPVTLPATTAFRPIGESSPISLVQHTTPDGDLDFLLLDCGDLRHILYTIYAASLDLKKGTYFKSKRSRGLIPGIVKRTFDFTCVEAEPAVLGESFYAYASTFGL